MKTKTFITRHLTLITPMIIATTCVLFSFIPAPLLANPPAQSQPVVENVKLPRIHFDNYQDAHRTGDAENKVTILIFGAEWCTWCKKIETNTLTDPGVIKLADHFTWSKIDVDEDKKLAAQYHVRSVPTVIFLNNAGAPLTIRQGYIPPSTMVSLMQAYQKQAATTGNLEQRINTVTQAIDSLDPKLPPNSYDTNAMKFVYLLAGADSRGRRIMTTQIKATGRRTFSVLVKLLQSDRLAVRAVAIDLLRDMTNTPLPFDPFADKATRTTQCAAWEAFLNKENLPISQININAIQKQLDEAAIKCAAEKKKKNATPEAPI